MTYELKSQKKVTREQVETLLKEYANKPFNYLIRDVWKHVDLIRGADMFIDDLMRLINGEPEK